MARDTIVAISTPPGRSGIGVVRASGPGVPDILRRVAGRVPAPREATLCAFRDEHGALLDEGIAIHFPAPRSFTGEDVAEFQAHGSRVVLSLIQETVCRAGARLANPGEFTERAYLNGRLDLAQAEAVADLIDSRSARAARAALRTLEGAFSRDVALLIERLRADRAQLEGTIDFPDDLPADATADRLLPGLAATRERLVALRASGRQGALLCDGATIAIAGAPNVGKSSLMNALVGEERAIVSEIPGTTRDVIAIDATVGDLPVRFCDTAGLRRSADPVEAEGIRRAQRTSREADLLVLVVDDGSGSVAPGDAVVEPDVVVHNKIDLSGDAPAVTETAGVAHVHLSAKTGAGVDGLVEVLHARLGLDATADTEFLARERHLRALAAADEVLAPVDRAMLVELPEVAAECYRQASDALAAITGEYTTEDLLGEIFSRFCIGK